MLTFKIPAVGKSFNLATIQSGGIELATFQFPANTALPPEPHASVRSLALLALQVLIGLHQLPHPPPGRTQGEPSTFSWRRRVTDPQL